MEIMLKWLFQIAAVLPLPVLHGLGNALGWVMYGVLGEDRRRIRRHLRQAGLPHGWRDVLRVCQETVKSGLELPVAFFRQPEKIVALFREVHGWQHIQAALNAGAEIILIGTGAKQQFLSPKLAAALSAHGAALECMTSAAACRTYALLASERRKVWAWLWV